MSHRRTRQLSNFYGPHHREYIPTFPGVATIQFYDMQPGTLWNPTDGARLLLPFICPARPDRPSWRYFDGIFTVGFNQRFAGTRLLAIHHATPGFLFIFDIFPAQDLKAINSLNVGTDKFAFGGTATISWEGLPSP